MAMVYSRSKGWPQKVYMNTKIIGVKCARPENGTRITENKTYWRISLNNYVQWKN